MKLATYESGSGPRLGVVVGDRIADASNLLGAGEPLRDVQALLEVPGEPLERLKAAVEGADFGQSPALSSVRLRAPVLRPPTVRDFMIFEEHATQQGTRPQHEAWYRMPIFYFSNTLRIFGPDEEVPYPTASERLDYELELGCVIGREGSDVKEADAMAYIAGFLIFNDWSCRDLQRDEMQVGLGPAKGKDSATSIGPWLVTVDEMGPYLKEGRLQVQCTLRVNGDTWLEKGHGGRGGDAQHTWGSLVERASRDSRIVPGDVIGTGTVGGGSISEAMRKGYAGAHYLRPGDVVEIEVDGLGILRNRIVDKADPDAGYRYRAAQMPSLPEVGSGKDYVWQPRR